MSGTIAISAYPRKDGATFDIKYYVSSHMPLVEKHWKQHGLKSWTVSESNAEGPYTYLSIAEFETPEGLGAAMQDPKTAELMEDLKNFSNEPPVSLYGPVLGRG